MIYLLLLVAIISGGRVENVSASNTKMTPGSWQNVTATEQDIKVLENTHSKLGELKGLVQERKEILESEENKKYYVSRFKEVSSIKNISQENYPYPHKFHVTISLEDFVEVYGDLNEGELLNNVTLAIAGRVDTVRILKPNIVYCKLKASNGYIEILITNEIHEAHNLRRGDIIGAVGHPGKNKLGGLCLVPNFIKLLAPCLHKLPETLDEKTKYTKRYLDLILNDKTKERFRVNARVIKYVRRFLDDMGFLEVETPMLQRVPGGATALPFKTHHDDSNSDYYLRIAPELYHKMLIVGGFNKVYEIGKQFRNEPVDEIHNPEFITCEFYMTYANYEDLMEITESLMAGLVRSIKGTYKVKYQFKGEEMEIDFTPPYDRVPVIPTLEKAMNVTFPPADQLHTKEAKYFLKRLCEKHQLNCTEPLTTSRMIDRMTGFFLKKHSKPIFITDYPQIMSPLAKGHKKYPGLTERFECYISSIEFCNAYIEQNDPAIQREQFALQDLERNIGDKEIPPTDDDFLTALEYGMPPTAGLGLAVERIIMLLTNSSTIRDVVLFPTIQDEVPAKN